VSGSGVLLRQFDALSKVHSWEPCPEDKWCGKYRFIWPSTIVNMKHNVGLYRTDEAGLILAPPPLNRLFCAYPGDGPMQRATATTRHGSACHGHCAPRPLRATATARRGHCVPTSSQPLAPTVGTCSRHAGNSMGHYDDNHGCQQSCEGRQTWDCAYEPARLEEALVGSERAGKYNEVRAALHAPTRREFGRMVPSRARSHPSSHRLLRASDGPRRSWWTHSS
jgi:hypothetical protein